MGVWSKDSKTHVATMSSGDFRSNEKSITLNDAKEVSIILETANGTKIILKEGIALQKGEIIDATVLSKNALVKFLQEEITDAKEKDLLLSFHFKATMMKVSDPIIFGHAMKAYFRDIFEKYSDTFKKLSVNANNGLESLFDKLDSLPPSQKSEITDAITATIANGPDLAMVNSDKGITNLHVPSDVIIDASMPAMIRNSGQMWDKNGESERYKSSYS